ncbi:hypothetical protein PsYK624_165830 [Phanerochaete sordida]|uniref:Uncharacterized protein n=1 Tax=Phanerochaete sordida TaxID=48140 RepID=A0A9P3GSI4_9APHY|nr:hypothetical protein PsYK624_165830 [Phanerochaete sordida]
MPTFRPLHDVLGSVPTAPPRPLLNGTGVAGPSPPLELGSARCIKLDGRCGVVWRRGCGDGAELDVGALATATTCTSSICAS